MFFSIIIPVYNAEKTLMRCLESVRHQTFDDFEAILVNDGSTDHSDRICQEYIKIDNRFRYFKKINTGVSSTRNLGIEKAMGKYIAFLDSDDTYSVDYLEKMKDLIFLYPKCENYWCGYQSILPNTNKKDVIVYSDTAIISLLNREQIMLLLQRQVAASLWTKVFRRSIITEHNLKCPKELSLGEDIVFNLEYLDACQSHEIVILNLPLYNYFCLDEGSLNHKYRSDLKIIYEKLILTIYKYLIKWKVSEKEWERFYAFAFNMYETVLYNTYHKKCVMSKKQKRHCRQSVINSIIFQNSVRNCKCYIHPLFKIAYSLKSEWIFNLLYKMAKLRKKTIIHYADRIIEEEM